MNAAPSFDPERLQRVNVLLAAALDLPAHEREAWLNHLAPDQQPLVPALRALLERADEQADTFMRRPAYASLSGLSEQDDVIDRTGDTVGPYRLLHELGSGGMATVWLAERSDGALQRQVALKLPRAGWAAGIARRMARERDILAALEHPLIARLYDAGVTDKGRPWLAMECVTGVPIDMYCREFHLGVPQRLRLFLQVADAVAHAHARLIVHRDLKPMNILVTPDGEIRLLDFGVAKLLADDIAPAASLTQLIGRPVTPDYASPEQVSGRPVTVATDIYSLGVVLYELLTGERPYRLGRPSAAAMEEAILAADVPRASTRMKAERRLARQLRGDLDTILEKTLAKDPARRYASVESMAADIQRHLRGEPVLAQPPSRWYRVRKFVGRNQMALAASGAIAAALLAGLGLALWQAHDAARERELAYARLAQTEAVSEFMNTVLTENMQPGEQITLSELMLRSERVAEATGKTDTPISMERVVAANAVAGWYAAYGDHAKAERLLARTLAALPKGFDARLASSLACQRAQAASYVGPVDQALQEMASAIEAARADPSTLSMCLRMRGVARRNGNDLPGALADMLQARQLFERTTSRSPVPHALLLSELGYTYALHGETQPAREHYAQALELLEVRGRSESHLALRTRIHWANSVLHTGEPARALALIDRAQEIATRRAPPSSQPSYVWESRGQTLLALGHYAEALAAFETLTTAAQRQGHASAEAAGLIGKAMAQQLLGQSGRAQVWLDIAQGALRNGHVETNAPAWMQYAQAQAMVWQAQGLSRDAHAVLTEALDRVPPRAPRLDIHVQLLAMRSDVARALGQPQAALADAEQALAIARDVQGAAPYSSVAARAWLALADARRALARQADARAAYANAAEHLAQTTDGIHPYLHHAREHALASP
jgi:eukaryotic-like serine/threonine-protein kinase